MELEYKLIKQIKGNNKLVNSFFNLANNVFEISFEKWYKDGFWTDKYIPYVFVEDNKVISNASVNIMNFILDGKLKTYIQVGTVMTDTKYRNKGLASYLINEIIKDYEDKCDAIYLFANETVLDFYPKFGFEKTFEYQYDITINNEYNGSFEKLDMNNKINKDMLKKYYKKSNPFSKLSTVNNYELLMFYCIDFLKNCVYYSKKYDAICIALENEKILNCFDIFCNNNFSIEDILSDLCGSKKMKNIVLGFTPQCTRNFKCNKVQDEETLFILSKKDNIFRDNKLMFPKLSHA